MKCSKCSYYSYDKDEVIQNESNKCELTGWFYFQPYDNKKKCIFVNDDGSINKDMIDRFSQ